MKKKRLVALAMTAALVVLSLSACGKKEEPTTSGGSTSGTSSSSSNSSTDSDNVIRIGVVASITGGSAIYGEGAQNSITMAAEEINALGGKYNVEIVNGGKVVDDGGAAKQEVNS